MSTELLLLGFASLILAAFSSKITSICGAIMHPHHGQLQCLQFCTQWVSVPLLSGTSMHGIHRWARAFAAFSLAPDLCVELHYSLQAIASAAVVQPIVLSPSACASLCWLQPCSHVKATPKLQGLCFPLTQGASLVLSCLR